MFLNIHSNLFILLLLVSTCTAKNITKIPLYDRRAISERIIIENGTTLENGVPASIVSIGNPPEKFIMALDTTVGYSWVRGSRCTAKNCQNRCTYYATRSNTSYSTGRKLSVNYGTGACVDTTVYLDTFRMDNLTVKNMPFGGVYRMTGFANGFDGYLGLGRNVDFSQTKVAVSTISSLTNAQLLESGFVTNALSSNRDMQSSQFGIYTTDLPMDSIGKTEPAPPVPVPGGVGLMKRKNTQKEPYAYLVLGGIDDDAIQGNIEYADALDTTTSMSTNWDVNLNNVGFGNKLSLVKDQNSTAVFSTSSAYITMPPDQGDKLQATFNVKLDKSSQVYSVKCSEIKDLPSLIMTLGSVTIELPPFYWTRVVDKGRDSCETRIVRGRSHYNWSLGAAFTNAFYMDFDIEKNTIGFAFKKGHTDDGLKINKRTS